MAQAGKGLVYGGGSKGLMGIIAESVLSNGGQVTGIIPEFLQSGNAGPPGQNIVLVPDMHARKSLMFEKADAFIALPGGVGTLEELVEQLSWVQLERHNKPVLLANIAGFWNPVITLFDHMRTQGFILPGFDISYLVTDQAEEILPLIEAEAAKSEFLGKTKTGLDPRL